MKNGSSQWLAVIAMGVVIAAIFVLEFFGALGIVCDDPDDVDECGYRL